MTFLHERGAKHNMIVLRRFFITLCIMIAAYSVIFHWLMEYEGKEHSWITGVYWTLTVMSTLGFGDITFSSDPGRIFSIVVLMSSSSIFTCRGWKARKRTWCRAVCPPGSGGMC